MVNEGSVVNGMVVEVKSVVAVFKSVVDVSDGVIPVVEIGSYVVDPAVVVVPGSQTPGTHSPRCSEKYSPKPQFLK